MMLNFIGHIKFVQGTGLKHNASIKNQRQVQLSFLRRIPNVNQTNYIELENNGIFNKVKHNSS